MREYNDGEYRGARVVLAPTPSRHSRLRSLQTQTELNVDKCGIIMGKRESTLKIRSLYSTKRYNRQVSSKPSYIE